MGENLSKGFLELENYTPKCEIYYTNIKELIDGKILRKVERTAKSGDTYQAWEIDRDDNGNPKKRLRIVVVFDKDDPDFKAFKKELDAAAKEAVKQYKAEGITVEYQKPYKDHYIFNPDYPKDEAAIEAMEDLDDDDPAKLPKKIKTNLIEMNFETGFPPEIFNKENDKVEFLDKSCPVFRGSKVRVTYRFVDSVPEENKDKLFIKRILKGIKVIEKPEWYDENYQAPEQAKTEKPKVILPDD